MLKRLTLKNDSDEIFVKFLEDGTCFESRFNNNKFQEEYESRWKLLYEAGLIYVILIEPEDKDVMPSIYNFYKDGKNSTLHILDSDAGMSEMKVISFEEDED